MTSNDDVDAAPAGELPDLRRPRRRPSRSRGRSRRTASASFELRVEHVDGDDPLRALALRALDHVEADATAADDRDGVALAMSAVFAAAPKPVSTPQPMSAARVNGTSASIFTVADLGAHELLGERAEARHLVERRSPSRPKRGVMSSCAPIAIAMNPVSHISPGVVRAEVAGAALRHERDHDVVAGLRRCVTPSPTSSTTPAPSWPSTDGQRRQQGAVHDREVGVADAGGAHAGRAPRRPSVIRGRRRRLRAAGRFRRRLRPSALRAPSSGRAVRPADCTAGFRARDPHVPRRARRSRTRSAAGGRRTRRRGRRR